MNDNNQSLEETLKKLQEDEESIPLKKWNEELGSKLILLFPPIIFLITFLKINSDKTIFDLFIFITMSLILILGGVSLNFLITRKNKK